MFAVKRILVPLDYTEVARAALSAAIQMADRHGAELFVLHVQKDLGKEVQKRIVSNPNESVLLKGIAADEKNISEAVEMEYQRCENAGIYLNPAKITIHISGGDWADVAINMVDSDEIDCIVAGTHGPKGLKGLIMGSMTEKLVAKATCSVFVVKPAGYPYLRD